MSEKNRFILHHYDTSPYAEKIRVMLGKASHRWESVLSPPYPPRPNLQPLVSDFRRIPVAHHGADVFCDTVLIAKEVAALTGHAEFLPSVADEATRGLVQRAEGEVFFCAITAAPALSLLGKLILGNGFGGAFKFVRDRAAMMKSSSVSLPRGKAAAAVLDGFLAALDEHLSDRDTMESDGIRYADFCIYHPLWLALSVGGLKSLNDFERVQNWYTRMEALGHGERHECEPKAALAAVAESDPREVPESLVDHGALGKAVSIGPSDYGKDGVAGTLMSVLDDRYVLMRETKRCGTVHLHFPRDGYALLD